MGRWRSTMTDVSPRTERSHPPSSSALLTAAAGQQQGGPHFGGHYDDRGPWPQRRVSGEQADVFFPVGGDELRVLLVRERLEGRRVEGLAVGREGAVDGVR